MSLLSIRKSLDSPLESIIYINTGGGHAKYKLAFARRLTEPKPYPTAGHDSCSLFLSFPLISSVSVCSDSALCDVLIGFLKFFFLILGLDCRDFCISVSFPLHFEYN